MSLRARVGLGLSLVAVLLVVTAALLTRTTRSDLTARVDEQLRAAATAPDVRRPGERPRPPAAAGGDPVSNLWVQVIRDGEVDEVQTRFDGAAPVLSEADVAALVSAPGTARTVEATGADRFRVMAVARGPDRAVVVGLPLDDVDAAVARLVTVEVVVTAIVLAVLALVAFWVLALGVRPLRRMTAVAAEIAAGDLSVRVPEADPGTEAGELGLALNEMLGRLEAAFAERAASEERLRRFVADASHELRTPITTIRGYAELHRRGGLEDPVARAAAMRRTEQEAERMGALVEDLLLLARLDEGRPLDLGEVDLAVVAADVVADARVAHPEHVFEWEAVPSGMAVVSGDDHRLRQVVSNLVANAAHHTPPGTHVEVTVRADEHEITLVVRDDGPGMEPELAERAFERFARGDQARGRAGGRTGLGLSIVASIVAAHGGRVSLRSAPGAGTSVRVELPT